MEKRTKIIIGVVGGLAAALGIFLLVKKLRKPKEETGEEQPKEEGSVSQAVKTSTGSSLVIKKPVAKAPGFQTPAQTSANKTTATGGKKVYVYARYENVKVYKKSTVKGVNLGGLYNTFNKGKVIGTYVGSTSIGGEKFLYVQDGKATVLVSDKLVYTKSF